MNFLKKILFLFLLCSVFCFIPKTYAMEFNFDATSHQITAPYNVVTSFKEVKVATLGTSQFVKFNKFRFSDSSVVKPCNGGTYYYRIDYQIFGWHNPNNNTTYWVNYAKKIRPFNYINVIDNYKVIGSIVTYKSEYELNISTFIEWTLPPSLDYCQELYLAPAFSVNDSVTDFYYYNSAHLDNSYYTIYDSTYEVVSKESAEQLINEYYETGSITQEKLDNITSQIVETNKKLEETNKKLEQVYGSINQTNEKLDDLNDNITNSDISGSQNTANGFFDNFTDNDYGLSSIITIPLSSIQKITNATCSPINLPIPFTNSSIPLPCMYDLYIDNVPLLLNIWQIVSFGLISYAIIVDIFAMVKKFKDPNDDKLEVMDL